MNNKVDSSIPKDEVHLKMNGKAVGKIVNLEMNNGNSGTLINDDTKMNNDKTDEHVKYLRLYSEGGFTDIKNQPWRANGYWIPVEDFEQFVSRKVHVGMTSVKNNRILQLQNTIAQKDAEIEYFRDKLHALEVEKAQSQYSDHEQKLSLAIEELESARTWMFQAVNILKRYFSADLSRGGFETRAELLIKKAEQALAKIKEAK